VTAELLDVTAAQYHTDPGDGPPSLTQSTAHTIISQSLLHAWTFHPRLGGRQRPPTKAKDGGTLIHKLLLGKGQDLAVLGVKDYRTNAAREARDNAIAAGLLPVKEKDYEDAEHCANQLRKRLSNDYGIILDGDSEVAFKWDEVGENGPVKCRAMMDHVKLQGGVIYDVKSIKNAHPKTCAAHMVNFGYDIQRETYVSALEHLNPELQGRVDFVFLFMELAEPYSIVAARPSGMMRELGAMKWKRAIKLWERALATNKWPGYSTGVIDLEPMPWHLSDAIIADAEDDEEEDEETEA
jgi:hypothetical protein